MSYAIKKSSAKTWNKFGKNSFGRVFVSKMVCLKALLFNYKPKFTKNRAGICTS